MDDSKTIYTSNNTPIYWFERDTNTYLDKTTLIYGETHTGKSTIINECMYLCRNQIPNVLIVAPLTSRDMYNGKVPHICIKDDLSKKCIEQLWKRQEDLTQAYNLAHDREILTKVFARITDREVIRRCGLIKLKAQRLLEKVENEPNLNYPQKRQQSNVINEQCKKKVNTELRNAIRKKRDYLLGLGRTLTPPERMAVEHLDTNPRLMLIIDDCSEKFPNWMKYWKKSNEENPLQSIFFRGRHNFITLIFAAHDDKLVDTGLRKNAHITIYTSSRAANVSLEKKANGFSKYEKNMAMEFLPVIFDDNNSTVKTYKKMCVVNGSPHAFQYMIATFYDRFKLCSQTVWDLAAKIPKKESNLNNNQFISSIYDKNRRKKKHSRLIFSKNKKY